MLYKWSNPAVTCEPELELELEYQKPLIFFSHPAKLIAPPEHAEWKQLYLSSKVNEKVSQFFSVTATV